MEPLVSIIIPVYNSEKYIENCLKSVQNQTYSHIEMLFINDGSTDHSPEIIRRYAESDSRIRLIHQNNGGVSAARNTGLRNASGKYCCFVDSDDEAHPEMVEFSLGLMESEKTDLVVFSEFSPGYVFCPDGMFFEENTFELPDEHDRMTFLVWVYLNVRLGFCVHGKLFRTDILREHAIFFQEGVSLAEDMAFNLKYLLFARKIRSSSRQLYTYYNREDSLSSDNVKALRPSLKEYDIILTDCLEYLKRQPDKQYILKRFYLLYVSALNVQFRLKKAIRMRRDLDQLRNAFLWKPMTRKVLLHPLQVKTVLGKREGLKIYLKTILFRTWMYLDR